MHGHLSAILNRWVEIGFIFVIQFLLHLGQRQTVNLMKSKIINITMAVLTTTRTGSDTPKTCPNQDSALEASMLLATPCASSRELRTGIL